MTASDTSGPEIGQEPRGSALPIGARKMKRRGNLRKLVLLALLLLLLAFLGWVAYYVTQNKALPIPTNVVATESMEAPEYLYSITGTGRQALNEPIGVAVGKDGRVYVVDPVTRSIKVFTTPGAFLFQFRNTPASRTGGLEGPVHLAIDGQGNIWVSDRLLDSVYVFSPEGKFIREFHPNNDSKVEWGPLALTFDAMDNLYVTDVGEKPAHKVRAFDQAGKEIASFGRTAQVRNAQDAPSSFYFPNAIAVNGLGAQREIFVADGDNRRVQVFSGTGAFKRMIVTQGVPRGMMLDKLTPKGLVLVVIDALAQQGDIYSLQGAHLTTFGQAGPFDGQFRYPNDVALDSAGRIFITDPGNNRVQVWAFRRAEVFGLTRLPRGISPWWCLSPLLLLPLLFLLRKRKFVVTPEFVEGMISATQVAAMDNRKFRWIISEKDYPQFENRAVEGVQLGELLDAEPYSYSDAQDLAARLQIEMDDAGVLSMAQRYKKLCTEDEELTRLASALDVEVFDRISWLDRYAKAAPARGAEE